ncbi:putative F-box/LRR-repeat protein 23 [Lactuca sativa]|nr:putative F-box/LRR-repeat protein 23 [Lactuca sativa]
MESTSAVGPSSAMKESPNWLLMPDELMENILGRLSSVEKLRSAGKLCRTWRRICKDPAMWKVIDIDILLDGCDTNHKIEMLTKQVVDLSCGELIDVSVGGFCTDDLLDHIALHSSKVKRLYLWCDQMTGSGLSRAVKRLSQLEELEFSYIYINAEDIEVIGRNCPQLKSFKIPHMRYTVTGPYLQCDDQAVAIANYMRELRHLQIYGDEMTNDGLEAVKIYGDEMTNDGLEAILNGCPHLQSLDIYMFCSFELDRNLVKKCMERIKDFKHNSTQNSDDMYVDESSEADD